MANSGTFPSDLTSLEPYILGKQFTGEVKNQPRCNDDVLENFLTLLEENSIAKNMLNAFDIAADFYKTCVDFKEFIPKDMREEVFYAAKVGKYYKQIPSFCVYVITEAWKQCYGIPNLIFKVVPMPAFKKFCEKNYFLGGITLKDVVCNLCSDEYKPLTSFRKKNKLKDFTEIYVESTDMVAAVPHSIGDVLDDVAIQRLTVSKDGLESDGMLLRTMTGHVGAINSIYDLRELL